jgi:exopolysaccharide production protein ExoQ
MTSSSTAIASVAAAVGVTLLLLPVRLAPRQARPAVALLVAGILGSLALYAVSHVDQVLGLLGRDSTLTGRALIWQQVQVLIAHRPLVGWGWGAVWGDTDFVRLTVEAVAHFDVPSAHNGYLDAWLQTGAIGLALFLLLVGWMLVGGLGALLVRGERLGLWATLFAASLLVYNVGEADLVAPLTLLLVVATGAALVRARTSAVPDRRPMTEPVMSSTR